VLCCAVLCCAVLCCVVLCVCLPGQKAFIARAHNDGVLLEFWSHGRMVKVIVVTQTPNLNLKPDPNPLNPPACRHVLTVSVHVYCILERSIHGMPKPATCL